MIQRQKKIVIDGKGFVVNFPNVGQIIDLESLKQALTNNRYGAMAASGIASMYYALDMVDAIAFFQVCVPNVGKYYNIRNYTSIDPNEIRELMNVYKNDIKPWFDEIMYELKGVVTDVDNEPEINVD